MFPGLIMKRVNDDIPERPTSFCCIHTNWNKGELCFLKFNTELIIPIIHFINIHKKAVGRKYTLKRNLLQCFLLVRSVTVTLAKDKILSVLIRFRIFKNIISNLFGLMMLFPKPKTISLNGNKPKIHWVYIMMIWIRMKLNYIHMEMFHYCLKDCLSVLAKNAVYYITLKKTSIIVTFFANW